MQSLDIISVNIWQILISLINLLIIYRILKKFLFKPVQKVMNERQAQVDRIYGDANQSRAQAEQMKQEYEQRLASAREEADGLVKNAVDINAKLNEIFKYAPDLVYYKCAKSKPPDKNSKA